MFNEILTGKGSNEPEKQESGPYRGTEIPMQDTKCIACGQFFKQPAASSATKCMGCQLAAAQANAPALPESMRVSRSGKDVYIAILIGLAIVVVGAIRYYIAKQRVEEAQRHYYTY